MIKTLGDDRAGIDDRLHDVPYIGSQSNAAQVGTEPVLRLLKAMTFAATRAGRVTIQQLASVSIATFQQRERSVERGFRRLLAER